MFLEYAYHWKTDSVCTSGLVSKIISINLFKAIRRYLVTRPINK